MKKLTKLFLYTFLLFFTISASEYEILKNKYYEKLKSRRSGELDPIGKEFSKMIESSVSSDSIKLHGVNDYYIITDNNSEIIEEFINTIAITHKELMYEALYNTKFGFYSSGKIILGRDEKKVSYVTHPEILSPNYGAMIAYNAYAMYRSMILSGDLTSREKCTIVELGAGNGTLAYDILSFIENCANEEKKYAYKTHWQEFYSNIVYIIGEISPYLVKKQKQKNKKYIDLKKMKIIMIDARNIDRMFAGNKIKGLFISNELPDAFPVHKIVKRGNNFNIIVSIATCKIKNLDKLCNKKEKIQDIIDKNNIIRKKCNTEIPVFINERAIIISKKDYFELKELAAHNNICIDPYITFYEKEIDIAFFKNLQGYVQRNREQFSDESYGTTWYINDGVEKWIQSISKVLDVGFIMTIDYGFSTAMLDDYMKCLKRIKKGKIKFYPTGISDSIYKAPGDYDITTDLNFSDQVLVGNSLGIEAIFYGPQNSLCGHKILINPQMGIYMSPFDIDSDVLVYKNSKYIPSKDLDKGSYYYNFKVLIQKTKCTKSNFNLTSVQEAL